LGWWLGIAVMRFIRSTKLLYAEPAWYCDGHNVKKRSRKKILKTFKNVDKKVSLNLFEFLPKT